MADVQLSNVTKRFGGKQPVLAVDELTLTANDGELLVLLGPSGCGKSTALRMIAGLETVTSGEIHIGDELVNDVPPRFRDVAMVFQSYALYPHLTVRRNVEFPLRQREIHRDQVRERAQTALDALGLSDLSERKPAQLSGGQRQRVALARAIVREPRVFLMDEPLSNLDATLRQQTRADIVALQRRLGTTTLFVTHDQVEAMTMGHRIAVLNAGRLQQVGAPTELYAEPANVFVARFLGAPGMNVLHASISAGRVLVGGGVLATTTRADTDSVLVGFRAEDATFDLSGVPCTVMVTEDLGAELHVVCDAPEGDRLVVRTRGPRHDLGANVTVTAATAQLHFFDPATGERQP
jgi:multiple sugar transport system ATP-binding protein